MFTIQKLSWMLVNQIIDIILKLKLMLDFIIQQVLKKYNQVKHGLQLIIKQLLHQLQMHVQQILLMMQAVLYQQQMKHLFLTLTLTLITGLELLYLLKLSAATSPLMDLEWQPSLMVLSEIQPLQLMVQRIVLLMVLLQV